jgi:thioredoxin 1
MTCFSSIPEVSEASFSEWVLQSELPALVAVCGKGGTASQTLLKLLEGWATQAQGRLRVFRLSAEDSSGLAERFGVPSAPSLVLFNQGVVCYQFTGEVSRRELDDLLTRASSLGVARDPKSPPDPRSAAALLRSGNVTL